MFVPFLPAKRKSFLEARSEQIDLRNVRFFQKGRQAMRVGLDSLELPKGMTVLMPASMCPAVLEPIVNYGLKVRLYGLDRGMQWDIKEISNLIDADTAAVYIIHYFGVRTDLVELKGLCRARCLKLIEDCALCGFDPASPLGRIGDVSIFSLWKFYPICDGAMLYCNDEGCRTTACVSTNPPAVETYKRAAKIVCNELGMRGLLPMKTLKKRRGKRMSAYDEAGEITPGAEFPIFSMTPRAKHRFLATNHQVVTERRRGNFQRMMDFSSAMGIKCLFQKLPAGSVPYCFPIVVNDPIHVQWCLKQAGIQTEIPINQPFAGRDYLLPTTAKLTDVEYLAHHVLGLPIHQDIDERELVLIQHAMTGL